MDPDHNSGKVKRKALRGLALCLATIVLIPALVAAAQPTSPLTSQARQSSSASVAPGFFEEPDWERVCSESLAAPIPPVVAERAHIAATEPAPGSGQCDEQTLYYGFGKPPDYQAALSCAYRHRAHPGAPTNSMLEGAGTLAMLYANGYGVPRDYALAIRFACEAAGTGGQNSEQRIGVLEALRAGKLPAGTNFDFCDEQMSGAMGSYCSELSERKANVGRARRISAIAARLSPEANAMLPALQADEAAFEHARGQGEYPGGGGSGSAGFLIEDQNKLREQFVINLERFTARKVPPASPASRQRVRKALEAAYTAALAVPRDSNSTFGTTTASGITTTQAAWEKLFQQWVLFTRAAFPGLSQDAVATELLRLRVTQLRKAIY